MPDPQPLLSDSARDLAREVLIHGPISRAELGRRLGLSPASLTRLSKPFLDRGLFIESAEAVQGAAGRPARPLDVRADASRFAGVKITGDGVYGALTDLRAGALDAAERPLAGHGVSDVVEAIREVVRELAGDPTELAGLGVSIGGNVADGRTVTRAPFLEWREVALADALEAVLGLPVTVENDVTALTVAQQWFGAVRGTPAFAVVTIGAGVGYGLVMHDRVITTPDTGLGLAGHFPLDSSGPRCHSGHRGCSSAMLSIPGITGQLAVALGRSVSYDEALDLAVAGDPAAVAVAEAAGRALGRMIAAVANLAMVDTVVLSGEGIGLWAFVETMTREALAAERDQEAAPVRVHVDDEGFDAWARGAAAVAIQSSLETLGLEPSG
jgi:predicted NBD/HSP70 family sugar kinase